MARAGTRGKTIPVRRARSHDAGALLLVGAALSAVVLPVVTRSQAAAVDAAGIAAGITGIVGTWLLLSRPVVAAQAPRTVTVPALAFLGWALLAASVSGRGWSAFVGEPTNLFGWLSLAALAAVALAAAALPDYLGRALGVVAPMVVASQLGVAVFQIVTRQPVRGMLPNSTYLGELIVVLLPFIVLRHDVATSLLAHVLAVGAVVLLAAGGSRVAAVAAGAWLFAEYLPRLVESVRARLVYVAAVVAAAVAAALLFAAEDVVGLFSRSALGERLLMWGDAWRALLARPIPGFGPDGFVAGGASVSTVERMHEGPILIYRMYGAVDPHNLVAWVAVSTGLVGLGLFAWFFVWTVQAWRTGARSPVQRASVWATCMAAAILLIAPLAMQVAPLLAMVVGMSLSNDVPSGTGASRHPWRWLAVALAVSGALHTGSLLLRLPFEQPSEAGSPRIAQACARVADCVQVDPYLWYLASQHLGWAVRAGTIAPAGRLDLAAAEQARALDSRNPFYALEVARTRAFYGMPTADVDEAFAEVFQRWPAFPLAHAERAYHLASTGRTDEAQAEIDIARSCGCDDRELADALGAAERILRK